MRHALKPKTPSGAARFNYINRSGKYERDKDDLVFAADCNMPDFAKQNALIFWENADEHERSDARICLELELNLPTELKTVEQQIAVVEIYIKQLNEKAGRFPISYAIHSDKNGTNPHVHLMLSERTLDGIERPAEQYFKRGNSKNPERGGAIKSRWWHDKQNVFWSRAAWAESCNQVLIANGFDARFDPRTKLAQREEAIENNDLVRAVQLSTLTETHEGPHVGGIRKRLDAGQYQRSEVDAGILQKIDSNDTIKTFNAELQQFAVTATEAQLRAFLACDDAASRVAFIADLIEPQSAPLAVAVQPEQLHTEALELDAVFDQHTEALELDAVFDQHAEALELDAVFDQHTEALELDAVFDQHTEALELDAVFDQHTEALELDAVFDQHAEAIELADVVRRIEQIDLHIESQRVQKSTYAIRADHIKQDYQALKRQQNALTANETIFNKLLSKIGFKSDSELLEPELERLSQAFNNAKSEREHAQSQITSLRKERDELMQLDVSEPLRAAASLRREAKERAGDAYVLARKALSVATLDKSFKYYAERDLEMIRQDLNKADYTVEDMQSVQQRLAEFVDSIDNQVQKQIARQQDDSQRPQSQPHDSQRPRSGPRL